MAVITYESFDDTTTLADLGFTNLTNASIQAATARFGAGGLRCVQAGSAACPLPAAYTTGGLGFAFRFTTINAGGNSIFLSLLDTATVHLQFEFSSTGQLRATRNGTLLGSAGPTQMVANTWYHIQIGFTIDDSTGAVTVKLNGVDEIALTSQDTRNGGNASINAVRFECNNNVSGNNTQFDDFYFWDTTGSAPTNTYMGDCRAETILPNADGDSSQFDGSDGNQVNNYLLVDEAAHNDDTDYVESGDIGDKDLYNYGALTSTSGLVYAVAPRFWAKKTDAGARSIASVAKAGGSETDSADKALSTTYAFSRDIREARPAGGAWTISDVNGAQFGPKVTV